MGGINSREFIMSFSNTEILSALHETLNIAKEDLNRLIMIDHPPKDYLDKIYEENKRISSIESLIRDYEAIVAAQTLISLF